MKPTLIRLSLATSLVLAMWPGDKAVAQVDERVSKPPIETVDVARLVRAKVPWTWLLKNADAGAAVVTPEQLAQAQTIRYLASFARNRGMESSPDYRRLKPALDDAALAEVARLALEKQIVISDIDRQNYLTAHPGRYDQYRLRHIYIAMHGARDGSNRSDEQARAFTGALHKRLSKGEQFDALARQYSDDVTTAAQGGELSTLLGAYMAPPFFEALRGAGNDTVTAPVKGDNGYHIIQVDQHIPADVKSAAYQVDQDITAARLPALIEKAIAEALANSAQTPK